MMSTSLPELDRTLPAKTIPLRVLFFDHTAQLGGGELALVDLVRHLDRTLVTPIIVLASEGPLHEQLQDLAETHILMVGTDIVKTKKEELGYLSLLRLRGISRMIRYSFRLAAFIRRSDIDLIHANSLKADILGGIAGKLAGRPVIWHVRDRIEEDYLPKPAVRVFRLLCRVFPAYVIGNSNATLTTLHLGQRTPATAIASGVDMSGYPDQPAASTPTLNTRIGIVGRLCPWKGQHIFLQAAAMVARRFPATRFQIIGAALFGEESYEEEIRRLSSDLGLESLVEFTGFRSDVKELLQHLDIVVHASTTGEPFGQVIVQGMAAAKPVVATSGGGVPEIVIDGETGILVPMGNASAMASAICRLLEDPKLAREMGIRGRQRVLDRFTIVQTAHQVENVYAWVARRSGQGKDASIGDLAF
jgi:glycosyltransferase involved in cell wall biosynthesis